MEDAAPNVLDVKLASVSHATLDAVASAIWGIPFYDTEFLVRHKGRDQGVFLHSNIVLMLSSTAIELDAMEPSESEPVKGRRPVPRLNNASPRRRGPDVLLPGLDIDDEEIILDDESSSDDFDDASITMPPLRNRAATPDLGRVESVASREGSPPFRLSSQPMPQSMPVLDADAEATRSSSGLFSRLMRKRMNETQGSGAMTSASQKNAADQAGRLRRYSGKSRAPVGPLGSAPQVAFNSDVDTPSLPNSRASTPRNARRTPRKETSRKETPRGGGLPVKRIYVKGASPRTVQALVFYLYTNQAHFVSSPHQSPYSDASSLHEEAMELLGDGGKQNPSLWPPAFSSKAAYSLGHQLDLRDLSMRAFNHLALNMSSRTVLADLLSPFGDRFVEVQRAQLDYITENWEEVKTRPDFAPTIEHLVHGQYPNSSKSLFQLFSKLSVK
ncbi:hypothetical protein MVES_002264 [Malassezia vespertilionis]|uniref:BTB domain-containing protein n=1 Tax=Malassezia vespertilionis TaxID=2020962 RepID=A0A2N1JBI6_9BASI|nr:hypothetical protein MVES_002264 [Malassezia vespertilionis]